MTSFLRFSKNGAIILNMNHRRKKYRFCVTVKIIDNNNCNGDSKDDVISFM